MIYLARFMVETATPIAIGSGKKGLVTDRLIARDANGLPYIPGTSLAGIIRHQLDPQDNNKEVRDFFGFQDSTGPDDEHSETGLGSRIVFSSGILIAPDGEMANEGLANINFSEGFYSYFQKLPERDHVRITDKGAADVKGHGKFDEELVHKGTRFTFEIELEGTVADEEQWKTILSLLYQPVFRIGAGTRKGFGKLDVISCLTKTYDLNKRSQLLAYLSKSSSLNGDYGDWASMEEPQKNNNEFIQYKIILQPEGFFHFGAGFGDEDVDMKPKAELFFDWSSGRAKMAKEHILIPATSIKGALSHRTAFYFNHLSGYNLSIAATKIQEELPEFEISNTIDRHFSDLRDGIVLNDSQSEIWEQLEKNIASTQVSEIMESDEWHHFNRKLPNPEKGSSNTSSLEVGEKNLAVKQLFGFAKEDESEGSRGKIIFSDVYLPQEQIETKVFSHVAIDRYTGGALDGALYQEKVVKTNSFELDIFIEKSAFEDEEIKIAFEAALNDLVKGNLQLGGNTTKGHGAFIGTYQIIKE